MMMAILSAKRMQELIQTAAALGLTEWHLAETAEQLIPIGARQQNPLLLAAGKGTVAFDTRSPNAERSKDAWHFSAAEKKAVSRAAR